MKAGWEVKPLGEVCELVNGKAYKKVELLDKGKYPVLRVGNFFTSDKWYHSDLELEPKKYCHNGDLLYAWSASFGPRIWEGEKSIFHYHIWNVQHPADVLDRKFLYYYFDWDKEKIKAELGAGATMIHVSKGSMEARALPIPPLEEQKRIVAVLDAAFEGLTRAKESAEANLQNARELFAGFTRSKMDAAKLKTKTVKLSDVCAIVSKLIDPKLEEYQDQLHLGAGNMITESDELVDVKTASEEGLISGKHPFTENDVLYSKIRPYLKKVARPPFAGLCSADVYPLTPTDQLDRNYLFHLLLSPEFTDYAIAGSGRAGMPKVNRKHMFEYEFELPSIKDQAIIANEIDRLRAETTEIELHYRTKLTDIADLRQSLLQEAFAGQLT